MLVQNLHLPTLKLCQRLALLAPLQDDMVPRLAIVNFKFLLDMVMHGTKATNRSLAEQDATAPGGNRRALAAPGDKIIDLNYDYSVVRLTARLAKGRVYSTMYPSGQNVISYLPLILKGHLVAFIFSSSIVGSCPNTAYCSSSHPHTFSPNRCA